MVMTSLPVSDVMAADPTLPGDVMLLVEGGT